MTLAFICAMAMAVDGDTIRCANVPDANGRVRLARIDAAELDAPGGEEAKAALAGMLRGTVQCELVDADPRIDGFQDRDRFGRPVARCSADGRDLGETMIQRGQAVRWPKRR